MRDVVRAARLAAERGVVGPLNVGTGRPRTLAELAAAVCRVLGAPAELVVRAGGRGRAGRDLGGHHPAGPRGSASCR